MTRCTMPRTTPTLQKSMASEMQTTLTRDRLSSFFSEHSGARKTTVIPPWMTSRVVYHLCPPAIATTNPGDLSSPTSTSPRIWRYTTSSPPLFSSMERSKIRLAKVPITSCTSSP